MTRKHLARNIVEVIKGLKEIGHTDRQLANAVDLMLDTLEPKNSANFARWGQKKEQSTALECWPPRKSKVTQF